jgi:hypothetical protein
LNADLALRFRCLGLLAIARAVPLLEASSCEVAADVAGLVNLGPIGVGDANAGDQLSEVSVKLHSFVAKRQGHDNYLPDYLQTCVTESAILVVDHGEGSPKVERTFCNYIDEAWGNCDYIVDRESAWLDPVLKGLKTTLVGIERQWREADVDAIDSGSGAISSYTARLTMLREAARYDRRRAIAAKVVQLAGWNR